MSKVMLVTPGDKLLERIASEFIAKKTIFDIPESVFAQVFDLEKQSHGMDMMGATMSIPIGPAAGPGSQIAPNIVAAYLCGSRIVELKTVQILDRLEVEKPCIDAADEGYNVEWSTELAVEEAYGEYINAWCTLHLLDRIFGQGKGHFIFNISVGYDLAGIMSRKIDRFLGDMAAPTNSDAWQKINASIAKFVESELFRKAFGGSALERARLLRQDMPAKVLHSATLSTMHGCPPSEIEKIAAYMLEEKKINTFVKLNPTLLGYEAARNILDATGWDKVKLHRDTFEKDLRFGDAIALVTQLKKKAAKIGSRFGIKLSNTLANENAGEFLPGKERYMSGRSLYPVTVHLAQALAAALPQWGERFSYCGGVSSFNAAALVKAGMGPVTVATDILKPGGYMRLAQMARLVVEALPECPSKVDVNALAHLARESLTSPEYQKSWREGRASIQKDLPLYDCFAAPCIEACPVNQKVPAYVREAAKNPEAGLGIILNDNPLAFITGTLCDHVCQSVCCRNDYEGSVRIRETKLECARKAQNKASPAPAKTAHGTHKVAIIGAGPAGLACAYFLGRAGIKSTIFDAAARPGGVVGNVIPRFRIDQGEFDKDIDRVAQAGALISCETEVKDISTLLADGFAAVFVATGAPVGRELTLDGEDIAVLDALDFLRKCQPQSGLPPEIENARNVAVIGGGNTAMDAARAALRLPNIKNVTICYRRSRKEMPVTKEEFDMAIEDGAKLKELVSPLRRIGATHGSGSTLLFRCMELGEPDASGRRSPRPTQATEAIACDLIIAAIGEDPDAQLMNQLRISTSLDGKPHHDASSQASSMPNVYVGGDLTRGPSSIIAAESDGARAAAAIAAAILGGLKQAAPVSHYSPSAPREAKLALRGNIVVPLSVTDPHFLDNEAERCLECDSACMRCVEVCPNRANTTIRSPEGFKDAVQIVHLDALCNECGNCGVFCPFNGEPYRHKPTLFPDVNALEASSNAGFTYVLAEKNAQLWARKEYNGPVSMSAWEDWSGEKQCGELGSLARAIWTKHRYLVSDPAETVSGKGRA